MKQDSLLWIQPFMTLRWIWDWSLLWWYFMLGNNQKLNFKSKVSTQWNYKTGHIDPWMIRWTIKGGNTRSLVNLVKGKHSIPLCCLLQQVCGLHRCLTRQWPNTESSHLSKKLLHLSGTHWWEALHGEMRASIVHVSVNFLYFSLTPSCVVYYSKMKVLNSLTGTLSKNVDSNQRLWSL